MIYLLPFLAIAIGYIFAFFFPVKNKRHLKLLLGFSGSFLLTLTVTHLLPEVYMYEMENSTAIHHDHSHNLHDHLDEHTTHSHENHNHDAMKKVGLFIMIGIVFQIILEYFSKGAEHGHVHIHDKESIMPWLLFISLSVHALLEGMPLSNHHELAWGISIHHFPIAIILTAFFLHSGLSPKNTFLFMLFFSLMTPLGTLLTEKVSFLSEYYTEISAVVVGILFHISSTIIFESSEGHKFNLAKLSAIVIGIIIGFFM